MKWTVITLFAAFGLLYLLSCRNSGGSNEGASGQAPPALSAEEREAFLKKGAEITGATFVALSGQLKSALQEEGVAGAVQYCNLVAYPLVDSLSRVHQADIRRTSLKIRNPEDRPSSAERAALEEYQAKKATGEPLLPKVEATGATTVSFYAPILIQDACLKCHGKIGETLQEEDYAIIKELYPEDEATGYQAGDLRGMWSVTFRR